MHTTLEWLEHSSLAVAIRQSSWLYPALEILHIVGIVLLVGPALMFDLRLLGSARTLAVGSLANYLLPWSRKGLILVIPSGILLFITNSTTLAYNPIFWIKMSLLLVAALNALFFHRITRFELSADMQTTPVTAKVNAVISLISWLTIIACGRLLAY